MSKLKVPEITSVRLYPPLPEDILNNLIEASVPKPNSDQKTERDATRRRAVIDFVLDVPGSTVSVKSPDGKAAIFRPTLEQKKIIRDRLNISDLPVQRKKTRVAGQTVQSAKQVLRTV